MTSQILNKRKAGEQLEEIKSAEGKSEKSSNIAPNDIGFDLLSKSSVSVERSNSGSDWSILKLNR